jgi:hypothetical protein
MLMATATAAVAGFKAKHCFRIFAILAALLLPATGEPQGFKVVPGSVSPDGRIALATKPATKGAVIVFYDAIRKVPITDDLSKDPVLSVAALAQTTNYGARHEIAWTKDSRRVAVWGGFHQLSDVAAYEVREGRVEQLKIPDLNAQWLEIERSVRPFKITKKWRNSPSWRGTGRLIFQLSGDAFRNQGEHETDFLDFAYVVAVEYDNSLAGKVVGLEKVN